MGKLHVISSVNKCQKVVRRILLSTDQTPITIGAACLGIRSGHQGSIALLVLATLTDDVYVFDLKQNDNLIHEGQLARILQTDEIITVFHDSQPSCEALHNLYGVRVRNVYDTQAAFMAILEYEGLPRRIITIHDLYDKLGIPEYVASTKIQNTDFWSTRPLSNNMVCYAASLVLPLLTTVKPEFDRLCDISNVRMHHHDLTKNHGNKTHHSQDNRSRHDAHNRYMYDRNSKLYLSKEHKFLLQNTRPVCHFNDRL